MENISSSCSSKSIPCASNASDNGNLSKSVVRETQNLDTGLQQNQEVSVSLDKSAPQNAKALKSEVWKDFDREVLVEGGNRATCKHCFRVFNGATTLGTAHLKNHVNTCPMNPYHKKIYGQQLLTTKSSPNKLVKLSSWSFDQNRTRMCFARMVAKHDYPFNMAEHVYFQEYVKSINPTVKFFSRNIVRRDVLKLYTDMRRELQETFDHLSCRVSLTTDLWTSEHHNIDYCCITCHYIDNDWKLQKKVIAYHELPPQYTGVMLSASVKSKVLHWNIDKKLFAITVDNASNNDVMVTYLKEWLVGKSVLPLNGELFHMRCCAHILNLIVHDGLQIVQSFIEKIRESINFTKSSQMRKQNWENALAQTRLTGKGVSYDVSTRWNSTYLMLESAFEVRPAFERLVDLANDYECLPSNEEWEVAKEICECLKIFYDVTLQFSGVKYPTANLYFKSVCEIYESILSWEQSEHDYIRFMAEKMKVKFDKYWATCNLMTSLGMVFDPRYRMTYIEFFFGLIYGEDSQVHVCKIHDSLKNLFSIYGKESSSFANVSTTTSCDSLESFNSGPKKRTKIDQRWRNYVEQKVVSSHVLKTELDKYLEDELLPMGEDEDNFDILMWWKTNSPIYPILARIARDILAVPVSTVASESTFSAGGRLIAEGRSSLSSDIVEFLTCIKDWLPSDIGHNVEFVDDAAAAL